MAHVRIEAAGGEVAVGGVGVDVAREDDRPGEGARERGGRRADDGGRERAARWAAAQLRDRDDGRGRRDRDAEREQRPQPAAERVPRRHDRQRLREIGCDRGGRRLQREARARRTGGEGERDGGKGRRQQHVAPPHREVWGPSACGRVTTRAATVDSVAGRATAPSVATPMPSRIHHIPPTFG